VAGTGHNTRPNRVMNPLRQAQRFDPAGDYVRRYVPELAGLPPARIHTPWRLDPAPRRRLGPWLVNPPWTSQARANARILLGAVWRC